MQSVSTAVDPSLVLFISQDSADTVNVPSHLNTTIIQPTAKRSNNQRIKRPLPERRSLMEYFHLLKIRLGVDEIFGIPSPKNVC